MGWEMVTVGPPFRGVDVTNNPMSFPPGLTDDALNVDGDGLRVAKRYGVSKQVSTAMSGPIYELAFVSPAVSTNTSFFLLALYKHPSGGGGNGIGRAVYRPGTPDFTDGGLIGAMTDASMIGTLHAGHGNAVMVSGPLSFGANARYFQYASATAVGVLSYAGAGVFAKSDVMAYHRLCMFTGRHNFASQSSRLHYSLPDAPHLYPLNQWVDAQNLGRYPSIIGLRAAGDILYAGGTHGIFPVTGATPETFKMHRSNADFGFGGSKSADSLRGVLYGIAARLHSDAKEIPFDLFTASGLEAKRIGEPVRSLILNTGAETYFDAKSEAWTWRDAMLFLPRRAGASAAARDMIYFHQPSGSFWRWTLPSGVSPNCLEGDLSQMWMGCQDGRVRYFDSAAANDDGTTFSSYWTSGPIVHKEGRKQQLRRVLVWGKQTSGGSVSFSVAADSTSYAAPAETSVATFALPTTDTHVPVVLDLPDQYAEAYVNRLKFEFAATAVGAEIHRIQAYLTVGDYV